MLPGEPVDISVEGETPVWLTVGQDGGLWLLHEAEGSGGWVFLGGYGTDGSFEASPVLLDSAQAPPPNPTAPPPRLLDPPVDPNPPQVSVGGINISYDRGNRRVEITVPLVPGEPRVGIDSNGIITVKPPFGPERTLKPKLSPAPGSGSDLPPDKPAD